MLCERDRLTKNTLEKDSGDTTGLLVDQLRHLDAASTRCQAVNVMLGDSLNVVAEDSAMVLYCKNL